MTSTTCECRFHRYHVVHVYNGQIYDHSQNTWDVHLRGVSSDLIESYRSSYYIDGMTAHELRCAAFRDLPAEDPNRQKFLKRLKVAIKSHGWPAAIHNGKVIWLSSAYCPRKNRSFWQRNESTSFGQARKQLGY